MLTVYQRASLGLRRLALPMALSLALLPVSGPALATAAYESSDHSPLGSYRRVLPLEGGSNFRDLGGYRTVDGGVVRRGLVFRSGAMTSLTAADEAYLGQFDFQTVVDLRSQEEIELFPNRWVTSADADYLVHKYTFEDMMASLVDESGQLQSIEVLYTDFHQQLKPQLKIFFNALLDERTPLVVNCSAGQDRTGVTSALLLTALGVPREMVVEDYLLSTDFRRPAAEKGDIDLAAAAKDNSFARMMLSWSESQGVSERPNPLVTAEGVPFLAYTLDRIEQDYGSVAAFLDKEIGVDPMELAQLRARYVLPL
ncbi:MAG: tyrosine-protein phosphatase [Haliea sp.]